MSPFAIAEFETAPDRRQSLAALRQKIHLSSCPDLSGHLSFDIQYPKLSFHPRSRRGGDPAPSRPCCGRGRFQSTLPQGGNAGSLCRPGRALPVSIHAPAGGQLAELVYGTGAGKFQSTPPPRGDRLSSCMLQYPQQFQSTPPQGGATVGDGFDVTIAAGFQSTPPQGGRRAHMSGDMPDLGFNPRPRRGGATRHPRGIPV